jgi:hypothetical protein
MFKEPVATGDAVCDAMDESYTSRCNAQHHTVEKTKNIFVTCCYHHKNTTRGAYV